MTVFNDQDFRGPWAADGLRRPAAHYGYAINQRGPISAGEPSASC